ncbi:hypothetical protein D3C71_1729670 [compost metagenome]
MLLDMAWNALSVSSAKTRPPSLKLSSQTVSMIFIFGESISSMSFRVSSSDLPTATINSSQMGRIELIASTIE